jgi:hypothetical protein
MRSPVLFLALASASAFLSLPAGGQDGPTAPDNLKPPSGAILLLQANASGDQIYMCDGTQWVFARPDAKLFDASGKQIGLHFAGPTWQYIDGSRVLGKAVASATPDPGSVPWLLLDAKGHEGKGLFSGVTSIQRIETKGGIAPSGGCDAAHKGEETRVHYTAIYRFYSAS